MSDLQQELRTFIVDNLGAADASGSIAPDADLIRGGIVDSLGLQQILAFCEERYAIKVDDDDLVPENFQTLELLAAFVERKQVTRRRSRGWSFPSRRG